MISKKLEKEIRDYSLEDLKELHKLMGRIIIEKEEKKYQDREHYREVIQSES